MEAKESNAKCGGFHASGAWNKTDPAFHNDESVA
jgi:hypothetical protein